MSRALRLAASVQRALPCPDPLVMTLAAKVFARLAAQGGSLMSGHVDVQVKSCIEWLQGSYLLSLFSSLLFSLSPLERKLTTFLFHRRKN